MEWEALHLFIHDQSAHNLFLSDYLGPVLESLKTNSVIKQYFFIVYWQGGNHIRVRYKTADSDLVERKIKECFREFLLSYTPRYVLSEEDYYRIYKNNKENVTDIAFVRDGSFKRMIYEPETKRYGGTKALEICEKIFEVSSDYALALRKKSGGSLIKRLVFGLDMFALAVKNLEDPDIFLQRYESYWKDFAPSEEPILNEEELVEKYKSRFARIINEEIEGYEGWSNAIDRDLKEAVSVQDSYGIENTAHLMILSSIVHMNNNRLGIAPQLESILARTLYRCMKG